MAELIPKSLRKNEAFRTDVELALSLPVEALADLVSVIGEQPSADSDELDLEDEDLTSAASVLIYLARRIARLDEGLPSEAALRDFAEDLGVSQDFAVRWPILEPLLGHGTPYQRAVEERLAFHFEPGYERVAFEVMLRPRRAGSKELVGGFHWTIRYHHPSGESRALGLQVAEGDVEELVEKAQEALRELRKTMDLALSSQEGHN